MKTILEFNDILLSAKFFQQLLKIFRKSAKNFMKITLKYLKKKGKVFNSDDFIVSATPTPAPFLKRSTFTK